MDFDDFAAGVLIRMDRIIQLLGSRESLSTPNRIDPSKGSKLLSLIPTSEALRSAITLAVLPSETTESPEPSKHRTVGSETFTELAPKLLLRVFDGRMHIETAAEYLDISATTVREIVRKMDPVGDFIQVKDAIIEITNKTLASNWLEPYTPVTIPSFKRGIEVQIATVLKYLMQPDIQASGQVTRSIIEDLNLSAHSCQNMVTILTKEVPLCFREKAGGSVRVFPHHLEKARKWVAEIESRSDWVPPAWSVALASDELFNKHAAQIVDLLMGNKDYTLKELCDIVTISEYGLRGIVMRLQRSGVGLLVKNPVGHEFLRIRLESVEAAEKWLSDATAPDLQPALH